MIKIPELHPTRLDVIKRWPAGWLATDIGQFGIDQQTSDDHDSAPSRAAEAMPVPTWSLPQGGFEFPGPRTHPDAGSKRTAKQVSSRETLVSSLTDEIKTMDKHSDRTGSCPTIPAESATSQDYQKASGCKYSFAKASWKLLKR